MRCEFCNHKVWDNGHWEGDRWVDLLDCPNCELDVCHGSSPCWECRAEVTNWLRNEVA